MAVFVKLLFMIGNGWLEAAFVCEQLFKVKFIIARTKKIYLLINVYIKSQEI